LAQTHQTPTKKLHKKSGVHPNFGGSGTPSPNLPPPPDPQWLSPWPSSVPPSVVTIPKTAAWMRRYCSAGLPSVVFHGSRDCLLCLCEHGLRARFHSRQYSTSSDAGAASIHTSQYPSLPKTPTKLSFLGCAVASLFVVPARPPTQKRGFVRAPGPASHLCPLTFVIVCIARRSFTLKTYNHCTEFMWTTCPT